MTVQLFENTTISAHFEFVFIEKSVREIACLSCQKAPFSKYFPSTLKCKVDVSSSKFRGV